MHRAIAGSLAKLYELALIDSENMQVLIRADASVEIGTGHVVRCVTLAEELTQRHMEVAFACRPLPGNLLEWLQQKGFTVLPLSSNGDNDTLAAIQTWTGAAPIDWLIVDHYGLDAQWEGKLRASCRKMMVIDDLANRPHDCDLLLDQNVLDAESKQYQHLIPQHCKTLLGPQYALLRPEFRQARSRRTFSQAQNNFKKILAFFGGSDPTGECVKAVEAFQQLSSQFCLQVDLVAGGSNPRFQELQQLTQALPQIQLHQQVNDMAQLMSQADISIGAGGTTTWERLCLGLPSLVIAVADNQVEISRNLAEKDYLIYLGKSQEVSANQLSEALGQLWNQPEKQRQLSEHGMALVDGLGVTHVAEILCSCMDSD